MKTLFEADFLRFPFSETHPSALVSPMNSRGRSMELMRSVREKIRVFAPSLSDPEMIQLLKRKRKDGIDVEVCLAYENTKKRLRLKDELSAA